MPFNGSGVWSYNYNWVNDAANGIPITASRMDAQFDDIGNNGLDNTMTRDGQGAASANIPFAFGLKTDTLNPYTASGPISLSAGQLTFPAIQNPSSDANTLDDYEENTWTPAISSSGGAGTPTMTAQQGTYVKIGRSVTFYGRVAWTSLTGLSGAVQVSGLPFATENVSGAITLVNMIIESATLDAGYTQQQGYIAPNVQYISWGEIGSTKGLSANGVSNVPSSSSLYISGVYVTAD